MFDPILLQEQTRKSKLGIAIHILGRWASAKIKTKFRFYCLLRKYILSISFVLLKFTDSLQFIFSFAYSFAFTVGLPLIQTSLRFRSCPSIRWFYWCEIVRRTNHNRFSSYLGRSHDGLNETTISFLNVDNIQNFKGQFFVWFDVS